MTIAEVGDRFDGDLLGDDPLAAGREAAAEATAAVDELLAGIDKVHLSYGDEDPGEYVRQLCADHLIHGWDLAAATGQDRTLDAELVAEVASLVRRPRGAVPLGRRHRAACRGRRRPAVGPARRRRPPARLVRRLTADARRPRSSTSRPTSARSPASGTPTPTATSCRSRSSTTRGKAPPGTEIFSTLGLSDYELGEHGARIELLMIAPVGLTSGTIPPILHHAGLLPIDADDVPELGDTYTAVEELGEVSPMDALYVGRPLYQPAGFNPFDNGDGRVVFWWLIPIYDVEADFVEERGLGGLRAADVGPRRRPHRLHPQPLARRLTAEVSARCGRSRRRGRGRRARRPRPTRPPRRAG